MFPTWVKPAENSFRVDGLDLPPEVQSGVSAN